jgi:hypothetical protein
MILFKRILDLYGQTEIVEKLVKNSSAESFSWNNKDSKRIVLKWIKSLFALSSSLSEGYKLEPLLFSLVDHIYLENNRRLYLFLTDLKLKLNNIPQLSSSDFTSDYLSAILFSLKRWFLDSQTFYELSIKNLNFVGERKGKQFYCLIREFHPRRLYIKHSWNIMQLESLKSTSVEFLVGYNTNDPISGHRFYLGSEDAPALGIAIIAGHHRIYELYRRFINGELSNTFINSNLGGDILVSFQEVY